MAEAYSIEERKNYCAKWRSSGLSKLNFSRENKISESALRKWLKLYDTNSLATDIKKPEIKFLEVERLIRNEIRKVEIMLPNGLLLKTEVESLSKLIKELSL
jgi:hypothetical protein